VPTDLYQWFLAIERWLWAQAHSREEMSLSAQIDCCDFVRLSQNRVVQASKVDHIAVTLGLCQMNRSVSLGLSLPLDEQQARQRLREALTRLRQWVNEVPEDPFREPYAPALQTCSMDSCSGPEGHERSPVPALEAVEQIMLEAHGLDLVGLYASGPIAQAMATNSGHRHWHQTHQSFFDFAVYADKDKAFKDCCFGRDWNGADFAHKIAQIRERLPVLSRPAKTISPGEHRALLAPQSVGDLLGLACWGGFSARAHLTEDSPLRSLRLGQEHWSPLVSLEDKLSDFGVPRVQENGYMRPDYMSLVEHGQFKNWYCSPRTAREFSVPHNFSSGGEGPSGLVMAAGSIAKEDLLSSLDTGIFLSNVWYLNYSDRQSGRFTGMSRFASLWVEDGRAVAPLTPVRFDDGFSRLFGDALIGLGQDQQVFGPTSTYGPRGMGGLKGPALLCSGLRVAS